MMGYELPLFAAAWEASDTIIGTLVAVWGFRRATQTLNLLNKPRKVLLAFYTFGLFFAPLVSVLTSFPITWITGLVSPEEDQRIHLFIFFLGDAFAILILTPAIVLFGQNFSPLYQSLGAYKSRRREKAAWIVTGLLLLLGVYFFGERYSYAGIQDILFILYPMLAWSALRFGVVFTNVGVYIASFAVFTFFTFGWGGTSPPQDLPQMLRVSLFVVSISLMAQVISVESLERRLKDVHIVHNALHDWVTDLPNMRHLRETVLTEVQARQNPDTNSHSPLISFAVISLDHYRTLTESLGYEARNALLRQFATYLRLEIPSDIFVAHLYDGDFGLFFRKHSWVEAQEIAQKIILRLETYRFLWEGRVYQMKPTIGLLGFSPALLTTPANFSSVTGRGESGASISQLASLVMKQHSSENVHVFDPIIAETQEAAWQAQLQRVPFIATLYDSTGEGQTRAKWLNEIQQALQKNRFLLYAQPIVALSETEESAPLRFEVLLRLQRQDGSLAFPPDFLPIAEHLDLTCSIDLWVIRNTLTTLEELPQLAPRIAMCTINISGLSLIQPTFAEEVYRMVRASSFPAEKIGFEILENAMLSQMDQVRLFSEKMHSLGCSISLDDFGTGISSFAYLKSLSVDYVKIDGSFVCNLKPESVDYAIVDAIRRVSEHMSIPVVAEWVTTQEVQQYLRALGIDYGQGYLFGEPIELRKLLQQALRNSSSPQHSDGATRVGLSS